MEKRKDRPATRREFLEGIARSAILAGLGALAAMLSMGRIGSPAEVRCLGGGRCGGCPLADGCSLQPKRKDQRD